MPANFFLPLAQDGLPGAASPPKRVIIVGAGMAGLVAAYELLRAGHEPLILEARGRVGGRIETVREPFVQGLHAEVGAMRIPEAHDLTMFYAAKFGLKLRPFTMGNPEAYYHINRRKLRIREARANPDLLGYPLAEHEKGQSTAQHFARVLAPIRERLEELGPPGWEQIIAEHDDLSTRQFLKQKGWSDGLIEMFGVLENQESRLNASFVEVLLHELGHSFVQMHQVEGGMDALPNAFLESLRGRIRFGAKLTALDQSEGKVTVHYETAARRETAVGDFAIVTVPFSVLRHIECLQPFSPGKQQAIRQLNYDASAKIFFQCRRRFWEQDEGIFGGGTVTDLAIRNLYYGEQGKETGRGMLLASYTWAEDAERWDSLPENQRIRQALENVGEIHPQIADEFEVGASKVWHRDEFAGGAFALFNPGQWRDLHRHIISSEGRIHFAGEHASLAHRWIQGAIESGLRAAHEVHGAM